MVQMKKKDFQILKLQKNEYPFKCNPTNKEKKVIDLKCNLRHLQDKIMNRMFLTSNKI